MDDARFEGYSASLVFFLSLSRGCLVGNVLVCRRREVT